MVKDTQFHINVHVNASSYMFFLDLFQMPILQMAKTPASDISDTLLRCISWF